MPLTPPHDTGALLAVGVPAHRIDFAARRMARAGMAPFAGGLCVYYLFLGVFHTLLTPEYGPLLALSCFATTLFFAGFLALQRGGLVERSHTWAWAVAFATVVVGNVSLYQVLSHDPRNFMTFALINVVAGVFILSRPVFLTILGVCAAGTLASTLATVGVPPMFDAAFFVGTWVVAYGMHYTGRRNLETHEAMGVQAEIALDRAERRLEQRDRAINAHERSQEGLRRLIESNGHGVLIVQTGEVVYVNRAFREQVSLDRGRLVGRPLWKLVDEADMDLADLKLLRDEADKGVELRFLTLDGTVSLDVVASWIEYGDSPATLLICRDDAFSLDAGERDRLADRVLSADGLAAGLAVELHGPLAHTRSHLEVLKDDLQSASADMHLVAMVDTALRGVGEITQVADDLATLGGDDGEKPGAMKVEVAVEAAIRMARKIAPGGAEPVREYAKTPLVMAFGGRLTRVFLNLLNNANQAVEGYAGSKPAVVVHIEERPGRVVVEIRDRGVGMDSMVRRRAIEPFFSSRPVGEGAGLGLAYCKREVEWIGGELQLESTAGEGTVVRVVLPAVAADDPSLIPEPSDKLVAPVLSRPPITPVAHTVRRVLVIDDAAALALLMVALLANDDVQVAESAEAGLLALAEADFDVILCDVGLPGMSGLDLYRQLEVERPELVRRLAFITGGGFDPDTRRSLEEIAAPILRKPFQAPELRRLVDQMAGGSSVQATSS